MACVKVALILLLCAGITANYDKIIEKLDLSELSGKWSESMVDSKMNNNQTATVFMDNLDRIFPVVDPKPLVTIVKGVGEQYPTMILNCLPLVNNFPPGLDDNVYFHIPVIAAELNRDVLKEQPLNIWIHPHLHIPYLDLKESTLAQITTKPMDIALYMANTANEVFPQTVTGVMVTATPLMISKYRKKIPGFRKVLHKANLEFGLIIENYPACQGLADKMVNLTKLLTNFDQFYFHHPRLVTPEESTGSNVEDAILETKAYDGMYEACKEIFAKFLKKGKVIKPVRGYLRAKYDDKDNKLIRVNVRFDVIRF